jgi:hypothetical protein
LAMTTSYASPFDQIYRCHGIMIKPKYDNHTDL